MIIINIVVLYKVILSYLNRIVRETTT